MQKQLADLMKEYCSGFVSHQTNLSKIKSAKLIGDNFIFTEMENGSTRIFRLEGGEVFLYGSKEVLRDDLFPVFKAIFRDARISSIIEE
jgi:hypothetical protein